MGRARSIIAVRTSFRYIPLTITVTTIIIDTVVTTSNSYFVRRHPRNRPYCS